MGLICVAYVYILSDQLLERVGLLISADVAIGVALIIVAWEACRRATGMTLPLFALIFVGYALLGHYLPPPFYHAPIPFDRLIAWFGMSLMHGIYGSLIYISANIIFLFVLFGAVLEITKAREFFTMIGQLVGRRLRGGSAETSVISSALVGSVSGSPIANIIITGAVTIPLMKKTGFQAEICRCCGSDSV